MLKAVSGLGLPKRDCAVIGYAGQPGQELLSCRDVGRVITLSFDLAAGAVEELSRVLGILYEPGVLTLENGARKRRISCRTEAVEEPEKRGPGLYSLVAQFVCDKPYFTDEAPVRAPLFYRRDLIESGFLLPCVFTERQDSCVLKNLGDVAAEPVFTVANVGKEESTSEKQGILLKNGRTAKTLHLDYATAPGETLLVDVPGRQIVSSLWGDVTDCLSPDSYLSDFVLLPGENPLLAESLRPGEALSVSLAYDNLYTEAVM